MNERGIENLRAGIVVQALKDYMKSWRRFKKYPERKEFKRYMTSHPEAFAHFNDDGQIEYTALPYEVPKYIKKYLDACRMISDCESFFRSEWYNALADIEGERIIRLGREKAEMTTTTRLKEYEDFWEEY